MRRSFFLLEVLVAVALVGGFAYYSIHGSYRIIRQQKKLLDGIDAARQMDVKRMDIIASFYQTMTPITATKDGFKITTKTAQDKYYLLELEEIKTKNKFAYFVVSGETAKN
jgi:Tfp pilus assembly protein PilE